MSTLRIPLFIEVESHLQLILILPPVLSLLLTSATQTINACNNFPWSKRHLSHCSSTVSSLTITFIAFAV